MGIDFTELNVASAILAKAGIADCGTTDTAENAGAASSKALTAPLSLSPLTLAYIGDCVYELVVRTIVVGTAERTVNTMHKHTCRYVNAEAQRAILELISDRLTEQERSVVRRGRNAKSHSVAKHASVSDYRHATGFEALCGYWYLSGQNDRMLSLVTEGIRELDKAEQKES